MKADNKYESFLFATFFQKVIFAIVFLEYGDYAESKDTKYVNIKWMVSLTVKLGKSWIIVFTLRNWTDRPEQIE